MHRYPTEAELEWIRDATETTLTLSVKYRRCAVSGKLIWLQDAFRVRHSHWYVQDGYNVDRWYSAESYILLRLQL